MCAALGTFKTLPSIFYAPAAFEFFIFALTAYRGLQDSKVIAGFGSAPFLMALYRGQPVFPSLPPVILFSSPKVLTDFIDGIIAFFLMTGMRVWNIWIVCPLFRVTITGKFTTTFSI